MLLEVRFYSGLEKFVENATYGKPIRLELPAGSKVKDVLNKLEIPEAEVFSILANGIHRNLDDELNDGDRVALFPPVGGG